MGNRRRPFSPSAIAKGDTTDRTMWCRTVYCGMFRALTSKYDSLIRNSFLTLGRQCESERYNFCHINSKLVRTNLFGLSDLIYKFHLTSNLKVRGATRTARTCSTDILVCLGIIYNERYKEPLLPAHSLTPTLHSLPPVHCSITIRNLCW